MPPESLILPCQLHLPRTLGLVVNVDEVHIVQHTRLPRLWPPRAETKGPSMGVFPPTYRQFLSPLRMSLALYSIHSEI